jgi:hypothetical protein
MLDKCEWSIFGTLQKEMLTHTVQGFCKLKDWYGWSVQPKIMPVPEFEFW